MSEKRSGIWTRRDVDLLTLLYEDQKYDLSEICEELGRSENSIRLKASRLKLKRPVTLFIAEYQDPDNPDPGIIYDEVKNTLTILKPVDTEDVLEYICKIFKERSRVGSL